METITYKEILQFSGALFLLVYSTWFFYKMMLVTKKMTKI